MKSILETLAGITALAGGWFFGGWLGSLLWPYAFGGYGDPDRFVVRFVGGAVLAWMLYVMLFALAQRATPRLRTAPSTSVLRRRPVGVAANGALLVLVVLVAYFVFIYLMMAAFTAANRLGVGPTGKMVLTFALGIPYTLLFFAKGKAVMAVVRGAVGRLFSGIARTFHIGEAGRGGSSRFAGVFTEWANLWTAGRILLGASLYCPVDADRKLTHLQR